MKLILIRHGDPDYENDALTAKGRREALLLADRVAKWRVTDFYSSPLGRAKETAQYCLKQINRPTTVLNWLKEFYFPVTDPVSGRVNVPWDFVASFRTNEPLFCDQNNWHDAPVMKSVPEIKEKHLEVRRELDKLLAEYGYLRDGGLYRVSGKKEVFLKEPAQPSDTSASFHPIEQEAIVVMFAHLGIISVVLSHLLGIPFPQIPHSFFLAPTSVTILGTEERWSNEASFRVQVAGCTMHLTNGGEPLSCAGAYYSAFQEVKTIQTP
ncbi:MAG: histidine phosphatase family protein [Lachnospiraceae bacterium]|nr:histidine phosphatase family protein [Lachnospiraceae bacterium]